IKENELHIAESALRDITRYCTREAGVRALERDISKICRKVVKGLLLKASEGKPRAAKNPVEVNAKNLDKYLGVRKFTYGIAEKKNQIGQVTGLAWTEAGGEVLPIGGLKEKLLAAGRGGIKQVLIPEENVKDLTEIPDEIKNRLDIHPVRWIEQVLEKALEHQPEPAVDAPAGTAAVPAAPVEEPTAPAAIMKH